MFFDGEEEARKREATLLHSDEDESGTNGNGNDSGAGGKNSGDAASGDPSGYYKTLGVRVGATPQEIRKAFLYLSQRYHTDKHTGQVAAMQDAMNSRFQELQEAYTVLSDDKQRAAYDAAGKKGAERLALVPANYTSRKDIIGYIHSLDREAELIKTARMLSATSDITVNYSTAALFLTPAVKQQVLAAANGGGPELPKSMTDAGSDDGEREEAKTGTEKEFVKAKKPASNSLGGGSGSSPSSSSSSPESNALHTASDATRAETKREKDAKSNEGGESASSSPSSLSSASPTGASSAGGVGGGGGKAIQAQMTAREVTVDGKKQIVFIPSEDMQAQFRDRLRAAEAAARGQPTTAPSGDGGGSGFGGERMIRGRSVSLLTAMALSAVPTAIVFRHSFQHALGPRAALVFRTDARSGGGRAQVSMTTSAEFQQDAINTYAASLRASIGGLKLTLVKERVLSPVWTLRSKLTCLNGAQLLQKLELALTRKLSESVELTNTVAWSINERGFFSSRVAQAWEKGSQGVSTYISYHDMSLTAFTATAVTYGTDTHDSKHPPARGRVQYSVNCSPFSGQTHAGFEAWYYYAPLQHCGLSFTTVIPYSISPVAPPLFFVESSQYAVVNQVSFLYARGQHRITVPVIVFISPRVSQALLWLGVPLACYRAARILYKPYAKAKAARYYAKLRREHLTEMDVAREKAMLEQRALEIIVMQSRASEDRKGGLVIINAQYGVLSPEYVESGETPMASPTTQRVQNRSRHAPPFFSRLVELGGRFLHRTFSPSPRAPSSGNVPFPSQAAPTAVASNTGDGEDDALGIPLSIDVTTALQNLVRDSALTLPAGTKSGLVGFCDPDPWTPERKQLKVTYWFRKRKHCAIFDDEDDVELPQREHRVD